MLILLKPLIRCVTFSPFLKSFHVFGKSLVKKVNYDLEKNELSINVMQPCWARWLATNLFVLLNLFRKEYKDETLKWILEMYPTPPIKSKFTVVFLLFETSRFPVRLTSKWTTIFLKILNQCLLLYDNLPNQFVSFCLSLSSYVIFQF